MLHLPLNVGAECVRTLFPTPDLPVPFSPLFFLDLKIQEADKREMGWRLKAGWEILTMTVFGGRLGFGEVAEAEV